MSLLLTIRSIILQTQLVKSNRTTICRVFCLFLALVLEPHMADAN